MAKSIEEDLLDPIRQYLETLRDRVYRDLRDYPQPVAGCDEQYKFLSERRDEITRELVRLESVERSQVPNRALVDAIDAFISSSTCIDDDAAQSLRATLVK